MLDPLINAAIWTPGDVATVAGLPYFKVKMLVREGVLRPKRGGGSAGSPFFFTITDAIAASVWAIYRGSKLPKKWANGAARFVAQMTAAEITKACEEGRVGIVPTNSSFTAWTLEPLANDLPAADRALCKELSLSNAVVRTNGGIKRLLQARAADRTCQTEVEESVAQE
jgi:hypothetical protein